MIDQPLPVASAAQGMASSRCCRSVHRWTEKRQSSARRVLLVPEAGAGCCGRALGRTGGLEGVVWSVQDEQRGCRGGRQAPVSAKPPDPHLWLCKCGEANSVSHRPAPPALDVRPVGADPKGFPNQLFGRPRVMCAVHSAALFRIVPFATTLSRYDLAVSGISSEEYRYYGHETGPVPHSFNPIRPT